MAVLLLANTISAEGSSAACGSTLDPQESAAANSLSYATSGDTTPPARVEFVTNVKYESIWQPT